MFQSLSLTNELDLKINKCKEIEKSIIASCGEYHGVQNDIIKDCLKLPCWKKYGDQNIYVIGLSDDSYDNYWLCCTKFNTKEIVYTNRKTGQLPEKLPTLTSFPDYYFQFVTCLYDVFYEQPDLGSSIKQWTDEEKKLIHEDTINFFKRIREKHPDCQDRLLYLAV